MHVVVWDGMAVWVGLSGKPGVLKSVATIDREIKATNHVDFKTLTNGLWFSYAESSWARCARGHDRASDASPIGEAKWQNVPIYCRLEVIWSMNWDLQAWGPSQG
jgi:hypothetical protein